MDENMGIEAKLHNGELYLPNSEEIMNLQLKCLDRLYDYNQTRPTEMDKRESLLKEMFAEIGEGCYIEPPFHANWGGKHCHFGKMVYANFNLTCVDDTHIYVGDYTMIGPNVTIASAGHPIHPELRQEGYQYNMPVRIGKNCWIGAGVIIVPGITIGDNVVIGAGSIVTKDLPDNVVAVGNPCRILRKVNGHDYLYYFKDRKIEPDMLEKPLKKYKCPCCGYNTYNIPAENDHGYICPVCFWENDRFVSSDDEPSESNHGLSLNQAKANFKEIGACEEGMLNHVREPREDEM